MCLINLCNSVWSIHYLSDIDLGWCSVKYQAESFLCHRVYLYKRRKWCWNWYLVLCQLHILHLATHYILFTFFETQWIWVTFKHVHKVTFSKRLKLTFPLKKYSIKNNTTILLLCLFKKGLCKYCFGNDK